MSYNDDATVDHLELQRPIRPSPQGALFELAPDWRSEWWGMPSFEQGDARPAHRVVFNFLTPEDLQRFSELIDIKLSTATDSAWYPAQKRLRVGGLVFTGPKTDTKYPVFIPSKGRADCETISRVLDRMGVSYRFVVEETEAAVYSSRVGPGNVLVLPFHDLGKGSIPARNWIWDYARDHGYARHWVMDDNIGAFVRCTHNRRVNVTTGGILRAIEEWVDRYENIAIAGPHDKNFAQDRDPGLTPLLLNSRVYSCSLITTDLPYRWRGRYNEDTDLCLRILKDGRPTVLFRSLLMDKGPTETMKGGNTDNVYNTGDHRLEFAKSLERQHPDVVKTVWRFNRWHHLVDYRPFAKNRLRLRSGVTKTENDNEFGMKLTRVKGG